MPESWKQDLAHLGTDWEKPFLEKAPWLIVVFKKSYRLSEDNSQLKNYYVSESVGIACGFLISAIHMAGLTTLTHTPSPMNFLQKILNRPDNEKPYLLLPVGYPNENVLVPNISKEKLEDISVWFEGRD
jgi:nitroreductase